MRAHLAKLLSCVLRGHVARWSPNDDDATGQYGSGRVVLITYVTGEPYRLRCCVRCGLAFWDVRSKSAS